MMWSILKRKAASSYSFSLFNNTLNLGRGSKLLLFHQGDLVDVFFPVMGEYITDGTLSTFLKKPGDRVEFDESIAEIVTAKVTIYIITHEAGFIQEFVVKEGDIVEPGMKVAIISKSGEGATTHVHQHLNLKHINVSNKKKAYSSTLVQ